MCKCMGTTLCVNGSAQFTSFFAKKFNTTIVTSFDSLFVNTFNLIFSPLKFENGLQKHVRNVARTKYGFINLVVIDYFLLLIQ